MGGRMSTGQIAGHEQRQPEVEAMRSSHEALQARLPSGSAWREQGGALERHGAAGTPTDQHRASPIVEVSMLLVRACMGFYLDFELQVAFPRPGVLRV